MDKRSAPTWEQERRAPVRVSGAEDGGGAPGPSTVKGKREMVKNFEEMVCFSWPPHVGLGDALKGASPGLGEGLNVVFCLVSGASCVGKRVAGVKQVWQCSVLLAVWRRYELRLLKLHELVFFANTLSDFNAAE